MEIVVTPAFVDAIVAGVLLECVGLGTWLVWTGAGRLVTPLCLYLASGACLLLALRASLAEAGAQWVLLPLAAALVAHVASLWRSKRVFLAGSPGLGRPCSERPVAGPWAPGE